MALGGGVFLTENKVLPGAYINFVSRPRAMGTLGERGTVCLAMSLDWGRAGMIRLSSEEFQTETIQLFGCTYTDEEMRPLREVFLNASTVLLYRLNEGQKAMASLGGMTITAQCGGVRGNAISVAVAQNVDRAGYFDVETYLDGVLLDTQTVRTVGELSENDFVCFGKEGSLTVSAGVPLTGGTNKTVSGAEYAAFLETAEAEDFQVLLYPGMDALTKALFLAFTKRLRNEEGRKFVTVLFDEAGADFEGVISLTNAAVEEASALTYWVAGATAGANVNESLTNRKYDGEYTVLVKYKKRGREVWVTAFSGSSVCKARGRRGCFFRKGRSCSKECTERKPVFYAERGAEG